MWQLENYFEVANGSSSKANDDFVDRQLNLEPQLNRLFVTNNAILKEENRNKERCVTVNFAASTFWVFLRYFRQIC